MHLRKAPNSFSYDIFNADEDARDADGANADAVVRDKSDI